MNGLIALVGSGEYLPVMNDVDRYLLDSLNLTGRKPRVVCLPTAAGQEGDGSIDRWSNMGVAHFQGLGAEVNALRIIDREFADDPQWESFLENADLIYFSGGDPGYLYQTMNGSRRLAGCTACMGTRRDLCGLLSRCHDPCESDPKISHFRYG